MEFSGKNKTTTWVCPRWLSIHSTPRIMLPTVLWVRRQAMKLDNETKNLNRRDIAKICHISHTTFYIIRKRYEEQGDVG